MTFPHQIFCLTLLLLIGPTGCGTVASHVLPPSERPTGVSGVYRGTKYDSFMLSVMAESREAAGGYGDPFEPFVICDLPLSVVADTLLLPFDAFSHSSTNAP